MANEQDLAVLESGATDLSGCDFSNADLSGRKLFDRNFERCNWQYAKLIDADCSRSDFRFGMTFQLQARGAQFVESNWKNTGLAGADFSGADLRKADFEFAQIHACNFDRANLVGANFQNASFQETSSFAGCVIDESTNFNGVQLSRALAREHVFRFYRFERGVLFPKTPDELAATDHELPVIDPRTLEIEQIRRSLDEALEALSRLTAHDDSVQLSPHPLQGHNNPPPDLIFSPQERVDLSRALQEAKQELLAEKPRAAPFEQAAEYSQAALKKSLEYVLRKADLALNKATEEAGKTLGNPARWPALYLVLAGKLQAVIDTIGPLLGRLL